MNTPVTNININTPPAATPVPFPRVNTTAAPTPVQPVPGTPMYSAATGGSNQQERKSRMPVGLIMGVILFLLLLIGGGVAFFLSQQSQDLRQQAAVETAVCGQACTTNAECRSTQACTAGKCADTRCLALGDTATSNGCDANFCNVSTTAAVCTMTFTAEAVPDPTLACAKMSYQDEFSNTAGNYTYTTTKTSFEPGDVIVFKIDVTRSANMTQTIALSDILTGNNLEQVDFMDSTCGTSAYNATTRTLTCSLTSSDTVLTKTIGFRVKVKSTVSTALSLTNTATATAGTLTATCPTTANITIPAALTCGSTCGTGGAQCPNGHTCNANKCVLDACLASGTNCTADRCTVIAACGQSCGAGAGGAQCPNDHTCSNGTCVLSACNVAGATCTTNKCALVSPSPTPSVSPSPTPSVSPSPSPAPVVCGSTCTSTAQCPNDHTCNAGRCELTACVNGAACTADKCETNACGDTCTSTAQCPNDHTCSNGTCRLTTCVNGSASCSSDQCRTTTCGSTCSSSNECPNDHTCSSGVCRLTTCVNGTTQCTNNQCTPVTTVALVPSPTPAVGCNQACATNPDCQAADHICVDTANGKRCRLESNISSEGCYPATQTVTTTTTQPPKTQALPQAGSADVLKAVGVGAAALLLGLFGVMFM